MCSCATLSSKMWCPSPKTVAKRKFDVLMRGEVDLGVVWTGQWRCMSSRKRYAVPVVLTVRFLASVTVWQVMIVDSRVSHGGFFAREEGRHIEAWVKGGLRLRLHGFTKLSWFTDFYRVVQRIRFIAKKVQTMGVRRCCTCSCRVGGSSRQLSEDEKLGAWKGIMNMNRATPVKRLCLEIYKEMVGWLLVESILAYLRTKLEPVMHNVPGIVMSGALLCAKYCTVCRTNQANWAEDARVAADGSFAWH